MAENDSEGVPDVLTYGIEPYPEFLRLQHSRRLIRMNDAKQMLRDAAREIDLQTPRWWQLSVAYTLDYAGHALLAFAGGLKTAVTKAGLLDKLLKYFGGVEPFAAKVAQQFAAFFGVRTKIGKSLWETAIGFVKPTPDKLAKASVHLGFSLSSLERLRKLIELATVGGPAHVFGGPFLGYAEKHTALKQRRNIQRVRKKVRSRRPAKRVPRY